MKSIATALVKAQKEFGPALKTSTNPHFRSRYADLSACVEAVIDALNNNNIYLMQLTEEHEAGVKVSTTFIHESGEQLSGGTLFMPASKHDAQGFGSALSYARRYSLMAACGIAPEDDDGNAATKTAPPQAAPKAAPKPAPAVPKQVSGKDSEWQLKVSAQPDANFEDWLAVVVAASVTALDTAESRQQVMDIWRTNNNIYELIKQQDIAAYNELLQTFGAYKEAFPDGKQT
jgi:hypothetical protein